MDNDAGIHDDLIITKTSEGFLIILNAACKDNDFKILKELLKDKYKMVLDENRSLIAIQGPKSSQILNDVIDGVNDLNSEAQVSTFLNTGKTFKDNLFFLTILSGIFDSSDNFLSEKPIDFI